MSVNPEVEWDFCKGLYCRSKGPETLGENKRRALVLCKRHSLSFLPILQMCIRSQWDLQENRTRILPHCNLNLKLYPSVAIHQEISKRWPPQTCLTLYTILVCIFIIWKKPLMPIMSPLLLVMTHRKKAIPMLLHQSPTTMTDTSQPPQTTYCS